jgi:hypothetical protein
MNLQNLTQLSGRLAQLDLFGTAPPSPPWGKTPTVQKVTKAINSGSNALPLAYRTGYVQPLLAVLPALIQRSQGQMEPFVAPVYEQAPASAVKPELDRFLAVISDLYRSFLDKTKRVQLNIQLNEQLPPLAFFQNVGDQGPYTIPASDLQSDIQTDIGVVSLPSTYRDDPILWLSLAHETGGHDVVHADKGLIEALQQGVLNLFGASAANPSNVTPAQLPGLLWAYWMDETVADVYGLLNVGPQFALNLTAFFSAMNAAAAKLMGRPVPQLPSLRTDSGPRDPQHGDNTMDEHPTDLLRLDVAIGVVGALTGLSAASKQNYTDAIRAAANASGQGATTITLDGLLPVGQSTSIPLNQMQLPLAAAQAAARKVGEFIVTTQFQTLAGHSIQDIETWDDLDEAAANNITAKLLAAQPIVNLGDDAQLLAGANDALLQDPSKYDVVTAALNAALDASFKSDPIWGAPAPDSIIAPARIPRVRRDGPGAARGKQAGAKAGPKKTRK